MARVFLLSKQTDNNEAVYADAISYGKLKFLIKPGEFIDFYNMDEAVDWLTKELIPTYKSQEDFVLLTGNVMINCLATTLLISHFDMINLLLFDGKRNRYILRVLTKQHFKIKSDSSIVKTQTGTNA